MHTNDSSNPVDKIIQEAMQSGEFANLRNAGKPLRLEDDTHVPADQRLAQHLLKENGFTLPWIADRQEVDDLITTARRNLRQAWQSRTRRMDSAAEPDWQQAIQRFDSQMQNINQRIRNYNLQVPTLDMQRLPLNLEKEIQRARSAEGEGR